MRYFIFILFLAVITSCNSYSKLLKSDDPHAKLEAAMDYYESESYYRTLQLLESVSPFFRGRPEQEKIYYYYAYAHYHQGEYIVAAFHFANLAKTLPNSQYAEESQYMSAYCKYLHSPDFFLDQTFTKEAIQEMQLFINKFPKSERIALANQMIDEMRAKMELKSFENAKMYVQIEEYQAAVVALGNVIKDFPGTKYTEEAMFLKIKAWHLYANGSIAAKQAERYEEVKTAYKNFVNDFPESQFKNEATFYYNSAVKNIEKLLAAQQNEETK
jgi:outer membrane protein assembly factor BamD